MHPIALSASIAAFAFSLQAPAGNPARAGQQEVVGNNFKLTADGADCKAGAECKVIITLDITGAGYHVNDSYPYKFKAADVAGVEYLGTDKAGKNVFSKDAGNFKKDAPTKGTMTVSFKAAKAGPVTIAGQYKMSVCSEQNCQLETKEMSVPVTVK